MTKQETALRACAILEEYYPKSVCALQYKEPYELLIAVRLSACLLYTSDAADD